MEKSVDNNVNRGIVKIQELNTSTWRIKWEEKTEAGFS